MMKRKIYLLLFIVFCPLYLLCQDVKVYNLRNCQGEMRTVTFQGQLSTLNWWIMGETNLADQRVFKFSSSYKVDSAELIRQIALVRKALPKTYFRRHSFMSDWFNNTPSEIGIWFLQVYAHKDKNSKFKALVAVKVIFEGDDARIDQNRERAEIKHIQFIFDKKELAEIAVKLDSTSPL